VIFEGVTNEALELLVKQAQDELTERRRGVSPRTLQSFLDPDSPNFMGLGMSIRELIATGQVSRNLRSFGQQDKDEQRRRLDYVIRLSAELTEILKATRFSTGLARQAIADVIEGDWSGVKMWADTFTFEDERAEIRSNGAATFSTFRSILVDALDTVPKPPQPVTSGGN
jgi:hypothetical protein